MLLSFLPLFIIECLPLILATIIYEFKLVYFIFFDKRERPVSPRYSIESAKFLPWEIPKETKTWQGGLVTWVCGVIWFFSEFTLDLVLIAMGRSVKDVSSTRGTVGEKEKESYIDSQLRQQQHQYSRTNTEADYRRENSHMIDDEDADDEEMAPYSDDEVDDEMLPYFDELEGGEKSITIESSFEYMSAEMFIAAENDIVTQESIEFATTVFNAHENLGDIDDTIRSVAPMLAIHEAIFTIDGRIESAAVMFKSCEDIYALDRSIESVAPMFATYETVFAIDELIERVAPMFASHEAIYQIDRPVECIAPMLTTHEVIYAADERIECVAPMFQVHEAIYSIDESIECIADIFVASEVIETEKVDQEIRNSDQIAIGQETTEAVLESVTKPESEFKVTEEESQQSDIMSPMSPADMASDGEFSDIDLESEGSVEDSVSHFDEMAISPVEPESTDDSCDDIVKSEPQSWLERKTFSPKNEPIVQDLVAFVNFVRQSYAETCTVPILSPAVATLIYHQTTHSDSRFRQHTRSHIESSMIKTMEVETTSTMSTESSSPIMDFFEIISSTESEDTITTTIVSDASDAASDVDVAFDVDVASDAGAASDADSASDIAVDATATATTTATITATTSAPKKKKNKNKKKKKSQAKPSEQNQDCNSTDNNINSRILDFELSLKEIDQKFMPMMDTSSLNSRFGPTVSTLAACSLAGKVAELGSVTATTKENGDFEDFCAGALSALTYSTGDRKPSRESMCA
ncbi:hypothetical protein BGZ76_001422 [Entomortierella beljakovae]|nr:hypothetical protein BGZ76_001422 [Entomortierella beljakovae]